MNAPEHWITSACTCPRKEVATRFDGVNMGPSIVRTSTTRSLLAVENHVENLGITSGVQPKPYDNTLSNRVAEVSHAYDNMHDLTPETGQKTTKTARKQPGKQPGNRTRTGPPIGGPG